MPLAAGSLHTRISIQERTNATDAWGSPLPEAWIERCKVWSNIRFLSGTESIKAGADVSVVRASIRIRWRQDVTAGMRVVAGAAVYDIEAVLPGQRREWLDLAVKRAQ